MATHSTHRFSQSPRRNSPSISANQTYHSHSKPPPQSTRDRFRDRSLPPRRYTPHDSERNDQDVANFQSELQIPQRQSSKQVESLANNSPILDNREPLNTSETSKSCKPTTPIPGTVFNKYEGFEKKQSEIFSLMLETISDICALKVENKKATTNLEASREKYDRTTCHHTRFPNLKTTLQAELDKAKKSVEIATEELARRDSAFKELAGQAINFLLPSIQAHQLEESRKNEDSLILKRLEKVVSKSEQHHNEMQLEIKKLREEQRMSQITNEKQMANQETQLLEMKSTKQEKDNEISELKLQLRALNDEILSLKTQNTASQNDVGEIKDTVKNTLNIANSAITENNRMSSIFAELERTTQDKFKLLETQISPVIAVKSSLKALRENGLFDLKASAVDELSTTLKVAVGRIDSLPSAASYFSLNSRLETLEKKGPDDTVINIENRLKTLEATSASNLETPQVSHLLFSAMEEKVDALTKQVIANTTSQKNDEDLSNLRSVTAELQRSFNALRVNLAGLHDRVQSITFQGTDDARIERIVETKSRKILNDTFRKIAEVSQMLAATNHSLENLMARVDNISTGHLAQAILSQLSETYPHIQNVEQLFMSQGECLKDLQAKFDHLVKTRSDPLLVNRSLDLGQCQPMLPSGSNGRNLGKEIDKLTEDVFKANQSIKKLITTNEEDRRTMSEMLISRLSHVVNSEDFNNLKTEVNDQVKVLIDSGIEELSKNVGLTQLDQAPRISELEAMIKNMTETRNSKSLTDDMTSSISKLENTISTLSEELKMLVSNETKDQKKALEALLTAYVDQSLLVKRPDFIKEVTRRVESKMSLDRDKINSGSSQNTPNPTSKINTTTPTIPSPTFMNLNSQRSKRKLQEIKTESPEANKISSSGRFFMNKKNRYSSGGMKDTP